MRNGTGGFRICGYCDLRQTPVFINVDSWAFRFLAWVERRRSTRLPPPPPAAATSRRAVISGKYVVLHDYLEKRYADSVVLTFAEIEDLLGFPLPDAARQRGDWWTKPDRGTRPSYWDSWVLANRTARPNLLARTVVFDREA